MHYIYLAVAIIAEVVATTALKASDGLTRIFPTLLVVGGYGIAFYMLSIVIRTFPVGLTYAIWAGLGIVLVALASAVIYRQIPDLAGMIGMGLIVAGVVVINVYSQTGGH